jgi:aminopeptidase N
MQYLKKPYIHPMKNLLYLLLFLGFFAQSQQNSRDIRYMTSGGALHPIQTNMDIRHYTLSLKVDLQQKTIQGFAEVKVILQHNTDSIFFDLVHLLTVSKVTSNKKSLHFEQKDDKLFITTDKGFNAGTQVIKIEYGGEPPVAVRPPWDGGFTWTKDRSGNPWVAINCQGEGGKVYFPCKDHPSDEPNEGVDLYITIPKGLVVAGPGLLQTVTTKKDQSTYHWKTNYTISNYCVIFNVAKYKIVNDSYTTLLGNTVPIQYFVLEEDSSQAAKVIEHKKRDTRILEKYFGEYPWVKEKIGLAAVPNPGMEHQTMVTFQNRFEYRKVGNYDYNANLFHEFAHEWWANKVTNKDWAHMWIQEGIATYAEALGFYELAGQEGYDEIISGHRRGVRNKRAMVLGDESVTEDSVYSGGDIYGKGSFFMHGLRYLIGDEVFLPTLKKLATDSAYTYDHFVTTNDVEQLFSKASGKNLQPFFNFYLRTTQSMEFQVREIGFHKYRIVLNNFFMPIPLDVMTDKGTERMQLEKAGIVVNSIFPPVVDPKGYYLKSN